MGLRKDIIGVIKTRLVSSGHFTTVDVWRASAFQPKDLPAVNIRYAAEADSVDGEGLSGPKSVWNRVLPVGITIVAKDGTTVDAVEALIGNVYAALSTDETYGGKAITTNVKSDQFSVDEKEETITGAIILLEIEYRTEQYGQ